MICWVIEGIVWSFFICQLFILFFSDAAKGSSIWFLPLAGIGYLVSFALKCIRIYILVLEQGISFGQLIWLYLRTTAVTLVLPWRSGEVYRIYSYAKKLQNPFKGFVLVVIDRYFDTLPLAIGLIIMWMRDESPLTAVSILIILFIFGATLFYLVMPSGYQYLNHIFLMKRSTKRNLWCLSFLAQWDKLYREIKGMVSRREWILIVFSCGAWLSECVALWILSMWLGETFQVHLLLKYLNQLFVGDNSVLSIWYIRICLVIVVFVAFISFSAMLSVAKRKKDENE